MSDTSHSGRRRRHLNGRQEQFCRLFVLGDPNWSPLEESVPDTRGHAKRAYVRAGYAARGASARAAASRLLRSPAVQARIRELRELELKVESVYLRRWESLLPDAQRVLIDAMRGKPITSVQIQAAKVVLDQALGPVNMRFEARSEANDDSGLRVTLWSGSHRSPTAGKHDRSD